MPSLMTLPREVRDDICTYAIFSPQSRLPDITSLDTILDGRYECKKPSLTSWTHGEHVWYRDPAPVTSLSLLQINRQLRAETLATLKRFENEAYCYELDIILFRETTLLPTWIRVPALTKQVRSVKVNFRIAGTFHGQRRTFEGFTGGDGSGPALMWDLYAVLERFFMVGPTGARSQVNEHHHISIKRLELNIQTPPNVQPERFGPPKSGISIQRLRNPALTDHPEHILDPGYLKTFIGHNIRWMIGLDRDGYGSIFHEHLDEVVLSMDMEEFTTYNVAEKFRDLVFNNARDPKKWEAWKVETALERRERGLTVLPIEFSGATAGSEDDRR